MTLLLGPTRHVAGVGQADEEGRAADLRHVIREVRLRRRQLRSASRYARQATEQLRIAKARHETAVRKLREELGISQHGLRNFLLVGDREQVVDRDTVQTAALDGPRHLHDKRVRRVRVSPGFDVADIGRGGISFFREAVRAPSEQGPRLRNSHSRHVAKHSD